MQQKLVNTQVTGREIFVQIPMYVGMITLWLRYLLGIAAWVGAQGGSASQGLWGAYNRSEDIWGYLWFLCEIPHCGKGLISLFQKFFVSIGKTFILAGGLGTELSFYGVWAFSWGKLDIPCLQVIIAHRFTCGERNM